MERSRENGGKDRHLAVTVRIEMVVVMVRRRKL
jgi:hypothetical protein